MFWQITHEDLNSKIGRLEPRVLSSQSIFGYQSYQWNETIELMKEIQEDFKKMRYPTKAESDEAWNNFFNLREDAYRIKREQFEYQSGQHYNEISGYLRRRLQRIRRRNCRFCHRRFDRTDNFR